MERNDTPWLEQSEKLVNIWVETEKMWKSWFDLMRSVTTPETLVNARAEVKDAQPLLDTQAVFVRFLERLTSSSKDRNFLVELGKDWQPVFNNYADLWQIYEKNLQNLGQFWAEPLRQPLEMATQAMSGDNATSPSTNLYWDYQQTFGNFLLSPSLGYTREFNNKLLKSFDAWTNFYKASFDYQLVLIDVWMRAFEHLVRLASSQEKGETLQNWRQFQQVWSKVFDQAFAQTFRSENALQIQGKFLNAAMTYRLHQQQLMEVFLKMNDLPTRSEVDEMHHSIYELRKEIKSLKKALAQSQRREVS
ncbi:class III poly(R)-hydroxyalkanoic acid synthase subunit PhaE [Trichocoleus sp. DQ-U1]|uniref:class III poly(R)-hydroxyalkanoic acid synthase subunit PhaE n=1 Tax=Trichocoleus sp. DQ-U1 TaxID=2933926 RepID=UPI003297AE2A